MCEPLTKLLNLVDIRPFFLFAALIGLFPPTLRQQATSTINELKGGEEK